MEYLTSEEEKQIYRETKEMLPVDWDEIRRLIEDRGSMQFIFCDSVKLQ